MALYSIGRRTTGITSGQAAMDVACSTGVRPKIMEIGFFLASATSSSYGLNRATALGTRTTPVALLAEDAADPALAGINLVDSALAWSAQPTFAAEDLRRIMLPATLGTGVIWTFPRGITLANSASLALVNRANNGAGDCHMVADI